MGRYLLPWYLIMWQSVMLAPALIALCTFALTYGLFHLSWARVVQVWKDYK